jgi:ABC-type transporter MlaC component
MKKIFVLVALSMLSSTQISFNKIQEPVSMMGKPSQEIDKDIKDLKTSYKKEQEAEKAKEKSLVGKIKKLYEKLAMALGKRRYDKLKGDIEKEQEAYERAKEARNN